MLILDFPKFRLKLATEAMVQSVHGELLNKTGLAPRKAQMFSPFSSTLQYQGTGAEPAPHCTTYDYVGGKLGSSSRRSVQLRLNESPCAVAADISRFDMACWNVAGQRQGRVRNMSRAPTGKALIRHGL